MLLHFFRFQTAGIWSAARQWFHAIPHFRQEYHLKDGLCHHSRCITHVSHSHLWTHFVPLLENPPQVPRPPGVRNFFPTCRRELFRPAGAPYQRIGLWERRHRVGFQELLDSCPHEPREELLQNGDPLEHRVQILRNKSIAQVVLSPEARPSRPYCSAHGHFTQRFWLINWLTGKTSSYLSFKLRFNRYWLLLLYQRHYKSWCWFFLRVNKTGPNWHWCCWDIFLQIKH